MSEAAPNQSQTDKAIGWRALTVGVRVVLQIATFAIVSRLVPIEEIGLMAEAMVVIMFLTTFSEVGIGPVLVQKKSLSDDERRTAIGIATTLGLCFTVLTMLAAPLVAWCYRSPGLTAVLMTMAPAFLATSIQTAMTSVMQRDLRFKGLFAVETASYALGYSIPTVFFAWMGLGVWSLVIGHLLLSAMQLMLVSKLSKQLPVINWSPQKAMGLLKSAISFSAARVVFYSARNADYAIVGRQMGELQLGLYSRAYILTGIPITRIAGVLNTVLFSSYSRIAGDEESLRRLFMRTIKQICCLLWPVLALTSLLSESLILGLLGDDYHPAAKPLQFLALGGMFLAVHNAGDTLEKSLGQNRRRIGQHTVYLIFVVLGCLYASQQSIANVARVVACIMAIQYVLMSALVMRTLSLSPVQYLKAQAPGTVLSIVTAGSAFLIRENLPNTLHPLLVFCVCSTVGLMSAAILVVLVPNLFFDDRVLEKLKKKLAALIGKHSVVTSITDKGDC